MPKLTLYHTFSCHLCEAAEALIRDYFAAHGLDMECLKRVDIADDEALFQRYGLSIPVLRIDDTGQELNWPFGWDELQGFL